MVPSGNITAADMPGILLPTRTAARAFFIAAAVASERCAVYDAGVSGFAAGTGTIEMFGLGDAVGADVAVGTAVAGLRGVAAVPGVGAGVAAPPQASARAAIARRAAASRADVRRGAKIVLFTP